MTAFEELLQELSSFIGTTLQPDQNQSCRLSFENNIFIQIDLVDGGEKLLLGCELGLLHPGPYRETVFLKALKMNGITEILQGILAFSEKKQELILFQFLPLLALNGEKLFAILQSFLAHAAIWIEALRKGEVPFFEQENLLLESPFGMRMSERQ